MNTSTQKRSPTFLSYLAFYFYWCQPLLRIRLWCFLSFASVSRFLSLMCLNWCFYVQIFFLSFSTAEPIKWFLKVIFRFCWSWTLQKPKFPQNNPTYQVEQNVEQSGIALLRFSIIYQIQPYILTGKCCIVTISRKTEVEWKSASQQTSHHRMNQ